MQLPVITSRGPFGEQLQTMIEELLHGPQQLHEVQAHIKFLNDRIARTRDEIRKHLLRADTASQDTKQKLANIMYGLTSGPTDGQQYFLITAVEKEELSSYPETVDELNKEREQSKNLRAQILKLQNELAQRNQTNSFSQVCKKRRLDAAQDHLDENHEMHMETIEMWRQTEVHLAHLRVEHHKNIAEQRRLQQKLTTLHIDKQ